MRSTVELRVLRRDLIARLQTGEDVPTLAELLGRPAWFADAACRGQQALMFPARGDHGAKGKRLCASCPVLVECRRWALAHPTVATGVELVGIWGGLTTNERRQLRRDRRRAA